MRFLLSNLSKIDFGSILYYMSTTTNFIRNILLFLTLTLLSGCMSNQSIGRYEYASKAPNEGWATDPILSYRLYSYYPMNFYNNGMAGFYGIQNNYFVP